MKAFVSTAINDTRATNTPRIEVIALNSRRPLSPSLSVTLNRRECHPKQAVFADHRKWGTGGKWLGAVGAWGLRRYLLPPALFFFFSMVRDWSTDCCSLIIRL